MFLAVHSLPARPVHGAAQLLTVRWQHRTAHRRGFGMFFPVHDAEVFAHFIQPRRLVSLLLAEPLLFTGPRCHCRRSGRRGRSARCRS